MSEANSSQDAGSTTEEQNGTTLLYCSPRAALSTEDVRQIRDALEEEGYILTPSEGGKNLMIQREDGSTSFDMEEVLG